MSLVEKALRKLQSGTPPASRDVVTEHRAAVVGTPASAGVTQGSGSVSGGRSEAGWLHDLPLINVEKDVLRRAGMLAPVTQERLLMGQFRDIKRTIIRAAFDPAQRNEANASRIIMLTSALPGDGKTFTCLNLAMSLAMERDFMVTLVDGDVAKPHITKLFGAEGRLGLLDAVTDPNLQIESVITRTNVPGLFFVPAGRRNETATEMMASHRMGDLFQQLANLSPNNLVVFDSSPMLLTSEARVLAGRVQQVLLVVKAGVTPQHAVKEAVDVLADIGARVGVVLNNADTKGLTGYGYGYGYGSEPAVKQPPDGAH